ncbi:MAG: hypothetical protein K2K02_11035, partial [Ruminococcus sp.]|nr:hypothetical protein [Ruminococcus sp.]
MEITLVASIMNDDVHGTDNDKKTGCGINLQKGDNINKYRRGGKTENLKGITCERCKNAFAKKMIKADQKERARLLKEEKKREKAGLADEGIIPLGGTVAKITSVPKVAEPEPIPQETQNIPVSSPEPEVPKRTIAGTGIALDSSLAQFNITPPPAEEPAPPKKDDFLAQFAVQKPQPEEVKPAPAVNKLQDDFLAQFAIDVPSQEKQEENFTPEESIDFSAIIKPLSAYEEPEELPKESEERPVGLIDEDDIMKMFAFGNVQASSSQSPAVDNSNYNYVTPVSEEPEYIPESVEEVSVQEDFTGNTDLDYVANRLFGIEENLQSEPEPEESQEMSDIELPSMDYISQEIEPVPEYSAPAFDDIELPSL